MPTRPRSTTPHDGLIQAAYFMALALGDTPSRRAINEVLKRQRGRGLRPQIIAAWLREKALHDAGDANREPPGNHEPLVNSLFGNHSGTGNHLGTIAEPDGNHESLVKTAFGNQAGTTREPATLRELELENCSPTARTQRSPQKRLPLGPDGETVQARAILTALWERIAPLVAPTMKRQTWERRNMTAARAMAHLPLEAVLAAHEKHRARDGGLLYTVAWLHERMLGDVSSPCGASEISQQYKPRVGPFDTLLGDGTVIYGNPSDPPPLSDLIAAGLA